MIYEEAINVLADCLKHEGYSCNCNFSRECTSDKKAALKEAIEALEKIIEQNADGCVGCAFTDVEEWEMPCLKCKRNCKDYWRASCNR